MDNAVMCANCDDEMWVCENHPEVPWGGGEGCCGGAGAMCKCHPGLEYTKITVEEE